MQGSGICIYPVQIHPGHENRSRETLRLSRLPMCPCLAASTLFSFYLFILQQDESHYGNVDGVPNAGVVEQTRHL